MSKKLDRARELAKIRVQNHRESTTPKKIKSDQNEKLPEEPASK